jgi:hypothetical protein
LIVVAVRRWAYLPRGVEINYWAVEPVDLEEPRLSRAQKRELGTAGQSKSTSQGPRVVRSAKEVLSEMKFYTYADWKNGSKDEQTEMLRDAAFDAEEYFKEMEEKKAKRPPRPPKQPKPKPEKKRKREQPEETDVDGNVIKKPKIQRPKRERAPAGPRLPSSRVLTLAQTEQRRLPEGVMPLLYDLTWPDD